jgi:hypothetical protein
MVNNSFIQRIILTTIISSLSLSCSANIAQNTEPINTNAPEKPQPEPDIAYGDLILKGSSDYLMIPVNLIEKNKEDTSSFNLSRYENKYSKLSNFIFYQKADGASHLLLNKKAIINSFDLLEVKSPSKPTTRFWLYRIIDQDTNKDKQLNTADATVGYLSDLSGKNLRQITPNNTQIINWVVVPSQNALFLKIIKDSNQDQKFTDKDTTNFVRVNLDKPEVGAEIISSQIEQEINKSLVGGTQK